MLSTYLSYIKYAKNISTSQSYVAAEPLVAREAKYYRDNINKVKTLDAFLKDTRLFAYAMKAYGLEDMSYGKAFMRKVLESDLTDKKSFANKLTDPRYKEFAKAFNFGTDGSLKNSAAIQTANQKSDTIGLYKQHNAQATRSGETNYFTAMIGVIGSANSIINNDRLRNYVLTAFGLDPSSVSNAALRNTLTSDLSDPSSYANTIGDNRFVALANAFNFATDGTVESGMTAQTAAQTSATTALYLAPPETSYAQLKIGSATTVDDVVNDSRVRAYLLTAYGLDSHTSATTIRNTLTSDLTDPNSYANQTGDSRIIKLAQAFNFATDGSIKTGYEAQSADQLAATAEFYYRKTNASVGAEADYYEAHIGSVTSVDGLLNDNRLTAYVLKAAGLDPDITSMTAVRNVLTSDLSDPNSYANTIGDSRFLNLALAFNFGTDGNVLPAQDAQSATQQSVTTKAYLDQAQSGNGTSAVEVSSNTSYYQDKIGKVKSAGELLRDTRLRSYIVAAYDLDASDSTYAVLKQAMESDLSDPKSYVNKHGDDKLIELVKDFNVAADGSMAAPRAVQSAKSIDTTATAYSTAVGSGAGAQAKAKTETAYYREAIAKITSLDDLMKDKRLTDFIVTAFGLDPKTTTVNLRKVLTSDLTDKNSTANKLGEPYRAAAVAFNFTTTGTIAREPDQSAQTLKNVQATYDLYIRQTMETEAGDENAGVRLALYFQRKASGITSAYDILADKALSEVVRTTLNMPDSIVKADLEVQARMITNKLKIADLKDAKKVEKFLAKFATLYDMKSNASLTQSAAATLLATPAQIAETDQGSGFTQDLLWSAMTARR